MGEKFGFQVNVLVGAPLQRFVAFDLTGRVSSSPLIEYTDDTANGSYLRPVEPPPPKGVWWTLT